VTLYRPVRLWLPVLVWAALIYTFSSIPSLSSGLGTADTVLRKAAHMTEYAMLAVLLFRALGDELLAFFGTILYAASDELHQTFVRGRHGSPIDAGIDAIGAVVGLAVWLRELRR
jgi:VanZ family protein